MTRRKLLASVTQVKIDPKEDEGDSEGELALVVNEISHSNDV